MISDISDLHLALLCNIRVCVFCYIGPSSVLYYYYFIIITTSLSCCVK